MQKIIGAVTDDSCQFIYQGNVEIRMD